MTKGALWTKFLNGAIKTENYAQVFTKKETFKRLSSIISKWNEIKMEGKITLWIFQAVKQKILWIIHYSLTINIDTWLENQCMVLF